MSTQATQPNVVSSEPSIDMNAITSQLASLTISSSTPVSVPHVDTQALIQQAQNMDRESLYALLDRLNEPYRNSVSLVDDAVFDELVDIYEEKFGDYDRVGALPRGEHADLPYYLGRLRKLKKKAELIRWMQNYPGPYVIEDKIDGLTLLYVLTMTPEGARTEKLYTQGTGTVGMNVSHIIPYLNIPKLTNSVAVRGEVVITKESFSRVGQGFKNPRNMTSGIVNAQDSFNPVLAKELKFYAYRIMDSTDTPEQQILHLMQLGFLTPYAVTAATLTIDLLESIYAQRNAIAPYEMDGLVLYQNRHSEYPVGERPRHVIAFKTKLESHATTVTGVIWTANKDRLLKPVIVYEPVNWREGQATLQRTNGDNARYIVNNGIGPGARVLVTRSGNVIPRIVAVLQPVQPLIPNPAEHGNYTWNANQVDFVLTEDNNQVSAAKIEHFFDKLEVKNIGPGRVTALVNAGFSTVKSILLASPQQLSAVLGTTLGQDTYQEIHNKIQNVPLPKLMAASSVFPNVGERRFEVLVGAYPQLILWWKCDPSLISAAFQQIKGFKQLAVEIANRMSTFGDWLADHPMITIQQPRSAGQIGAICPAPRGTLLTIDTSVPAIPQNLTGMTIVFSGFRDKNLENAIQERGGRVTGSVSRNTTFLVMRNLADAKGKANKATELGVRVITIDEFRSQYLS